MESLTFPTLELAWAAAAGAVPLPDGLLPPASQWFVKIEDLREETSAAVRLMQRRALRTVRTAVISPADCPMPELADAPSALAPGSAMVVMVHGEATGRAGTQVAFDYQWVREITTGAFKSDLGLNVDGGLDAAVEVAFTGEFLLVLAREASGGLRLRMTRNSPATLSASAGIRIGAQLHTPLPERPGDLVRAVLGVHDTHWFEALTAQYGEWLAARLRIPMEALEGTVAVWRALDPAFAGSLWQAFRDGASLESVRDWIPRIAAFESADQFQEAIEPVDSAPFRGTAAHRCVDAAAGSLLEALTNPEAWAKLQAAARQAAALCTDDALARALHRLRVYASYEFAEKKLARAARYPQASVDPWLRERIGVAVRERGGIDAFRSVTAFVQRVYEQVRTALEKKLSAALSWRFERYWKDEALIDVGFDTPEAALEPFGMALAGDLGGILESAATIHDAVLTHGIGGQSRIELRLPLFDKGEWAATWQSLASAHIEAGENGRITVYSVTAADKIEKGRTQQSALVLTGALAGSSGSNELRAAYTDLRRFPREQARIQLEPLINAYGFPGSALAWIAAAGAGEIEAAFTLEAPPDAATAWLRAPRDKDPAFFPVWAAVSIALQQTLRRWLPYAWFSDIRRYDNLNAAWPLMVYQCTRPYPSKPPAEFTYDIMEAGRLRIARQSTGRALKVEMKRAGEILAAAGKRRTAKFYLEMRPEAVLSSVEKQPLNFNSLIQADTTFVNAVIDLGRRSWELSATLDTDPVQSVRELAGFAADFTRQFHRRLRRLYAGESFPAFGTLLLVEAARALGSAVGGVSAPAGTLRLRAGDAEQVFRTDPPITPAESAQAA
ncbi:MAG TPA: hypothetical protein VN428_02800 [Bryobacteraceae bacterium]|nr:hypothetical protein [Bryobacteraceae bacterium]